MGNWCRLADSCDGLALARCLLAACCRWLFACTWRSRLWFCVGHDAIILRLRPAEPAYIGWALVQPHELLLVDVGGDLFLSLSAAYARALASGAPTPPLPPSAGVGPPQLAAEGAMGPLVLGYVSSDFTAHATSHLIKGLFALHDAKAISAVCLDLAPPSSANDKGQGQEWFQEIARHCRMLPLHGAVDHAAARIRAANVQVPTASTCISATF